MKVDVSLTQKLESLHVYACTVTTEKKLKVFTTILMWFEVFEMAEIRCFNLVSLLSKTRKQRIF